MGWLELKIAADDTDTGSCDCGHCIREPLAPAALAGRIVASWLRDEAHVEDPDEGTLGWDIDEEDVLAMLRDDVCEGHMIWVPRETAVVVAALVHALMEHHVARFIATQSVAS